MVTLTINGKRVQAEVGEMLLQVMRREKINVPALCHHDAIEPFGACRLCTVAITKSGWDGWQDYVTSCLYPVAEGLIVQTHSTEVIAIRRDILDLLLASSPGAEAIRQLAAEYGLDVSSYEPDPEGDDCIMCGLCTRACNALGMNAIATVERGKRKVVDTPFGEASADCIGCVICADVCPTGHISFQENGLSRHIWYQEFRIATCVECGRPLDITTKMIPHFSKRQGLPEDYFEHCTECKQKQTVEKFNTIIDRTGEVVE